MKSLFHLAYNITDIDAARQFYGTVLGCTEGRSTDTWIDFDFFGHQISLHLGTPFMTENTGHVGEHMVPMPHLGIVLHQADWRALADRLIAHNITFEIEPQTRYAGQAGEQSIMFFRDPAGNPIEAKGFADFGGVFAT